MRKANNEFTTRAGLGGTVEVGKRVSSRRAAMTPEQSDGGSKDKQSEGGGESSQMGGGSRSNQVGGGSEHKEE